MRADLKLYKHIHAKKDNNLSQPLKRAPKDMRLMRVESKFCEPRLVISKSYVTNRAGPFQYIW